MSGWFRQIALMARVRTGASASFFVLILLAVVALLGTLLSLWLAAFVWLANSLGGVSAGLILGGICALIAMIAALAAMLARWHEIERAKRELEERRRASLLDPALIRIALQVGQSLGWRRLATLAAVGLFAMGLGREWFGAREDKPDGDKQ